MSDEQSNSKGKGKQVAGAAARAALKATGGTGIVIVVVLLLVLVLMGIFLAVALLLSDSDADQAQPASGCVASDGEGVAVPAEYEDAIQDAADEADLPYGIVAALLYTESQWDETAVSPVGAQGLAQFMPETWALYGQGDPFDPHASIAASGKFLGELQGMVDDVATTDQEHIEYTLAAYNAGPGAVQQHGGIPPYPETQDYVPTIMDRAQVEFSDDCTPPGGSEIGDLGSGEWTHPLPGGRTTSGFGPRPCPAGTECNKYTANHGGLDFAAGGGATVVAATDMQITATGTNQYQGEYVIGRMTDEPSLVFQFHHCQTGSTSVTEGDTVAVGTPLCTEGATGNASGAHLHFQINTEAADDSQPTYDHATDPQPILVEKGVL